MSPRDVTTQRTPPAPRPVPPAEESQLGLRTYLTDTPGTGGRLRTEPEDFRVIELGDGPTPLEGGKFAAARIRLRNWETNRFVGRAIHDLRLRRGGVAFAGMKDKRAVTEQWFTFQCPTDRVLALTDLDDVEILEGPYAVRKAHYTGAHTGNRFVLRIRGHTAEPAQVAACLDQVRSAGGVPNFFGPQRFGAGVRPVTAAMGERIVAGDLEGAVRLYVGNPHPGENEEARRARALFDDTGDPEAALAVYPARLDLERSILGRLVRHPGQWRNALQALPQNLLQLFVHSHQSLLFNEILCARLEAGMGLTTAQVGDRVMPSDDDGVRTVAVTASNQERVQRELDRGRAVLTAPLVGMDSQWAEGTPGELERRVLEAHRIDPTAFRCSALPEVASPGRRRGILMPVRDLDLDWVDGDPVVSFALGKGSYATVFMREVMKADITAY